MRNNNKLIIMLISSAIGTILLSSSNAENYEYVFSIIDGPKLIQREKVKLTDGSTSEIPEGFDGIIYSEKTKWYGRKKYYAIIQIDDKNTVEYEVVKYKDCYIILPSECQDKDNYKIKFETLLRKAKSEKSLKDLAIEKCKANEQAEKEKEKEKEEKKEREEREKKEREEREKKGAASSAIISAGNHFLTPSNFLGYSALALLPWAALRAHRQLVKLGIYQGRAKLGEKKWASRFNIFLKRMKKDRVIQTYFALSGLWATGKFLAFLSPRAQFLNKPMFGLHSFGKKQS
ncbi:hypothetical protein ACFLY6_00265 [Candidatus Dependentiae bacterium]